MTQTQDINDMNDFHAACLAGELHEAERVAKRVLSTSAQLKRRLHRLCIVTPDAPDEVMAGLARQYAISVRRVQTAQESAHKLQARIERILEEAGPDAEAVCYRAAQMLESASA